MLAFWTLLTLAWAAPEMIPEQPADLTGRTAPPIEAERLGGGAFDLEAHRGRPVVLSFWASWCGPCRFELPALDALQKQRDDIDIIAVNVDRNPEDARRFLSRVPIDLPVVLDPEARLLGSYQVLSMPTMFLVDPNGTIKLVKVGYSEERGLTELEDALAKVGR